MKAYDELKLAVKAGYAYFYMQTYEPGVAADEIALMLAKCNYKAMTFDFTETPDIDGIIEAWDQSEAKTMLIAKNLNWFMVDSVGEFNKEIISLLQNRADVYAAANTRKILVILSDAQFSDAIPAPLQKDFMQINIGLPNAEDIKREYDFIVESVKQSKPDFAFPDKEVEEQILLSCRGMTIREIRNALSFSLVKDKALIPKTVAQIRAKGIEKVAGIKVGRWPDTFESIQGYENIKEFSTATLKHPLSKGIMLLGPPGTGKTHFCHCLGNETGLEVYEMEVASLFGGLVGESEKLMKAALEIISANAPCILLIDEIEKALSGMGKGQSGDGGTTKRSLAQLLKFLSDDRPEGVYIVATCNDISSLPPEWVRAERWDCAPFYLSLPSEKERDAIYKFYLDKFEVETGGFEAEDMKGWSGAEIKAACRIAKMMGVTVKEIRGYIVPISSTMANEINNLEQWAKGKTIPASFAMPEKTKEAGKRSIEM